MPRPSDEPIRVHDLPGEAKRLRAEAEFLVAEIETRGRTTALLLRAKDLRRRFRRVKGVIDYTETCIAAVRIAFRERTGRELLADESYGQKDLERAKVIVAAWESRAGRC